MDTNLGVVYIITNFNKTKHKGIFEEFCRKSMWYVKKYVRIPVALASFESADEVKADFHIDNAEYVNQYLEPTNKSGLMLAELMKTYICEWSPFKRTIYMDCDAFPIRSALMDYSNVLDSGYELSVATCATMGWKDSLYNTPLRQHITRGIPSYYPYWNFGVFGCDKERSKPIMEHIRENYLKYAFARGGFNERGRGVPHAQPALSRTAYERSPDHKIFTMPARYNCHFSFGGYTFSGEPVVIHAWKDARDIIFNATES